MVAFCMRRLFRGAMTILMMTYFLYMILVYFPGGVLDQAPPGHWWELYPYQVNYQHHYKLDKPWPANYLTWLFDSDTTQRVDPNRGEYVQVGIDIQVLGFHLQGSGLLTGDFGESVRVARGMPVLMLLGPSFPFVASFLICSILALMLIATLQRIGHRPFCHLRHSPTLPSEGALFTFHYNRVC